MLSYAQKMHLIIYTTNQVIYFFKLIVFTIPCGSLLNGSVKYFLPNHRGVNIIQFRSILASFGSMYFFYFKAQMLEFQKIFLLVRFFNWISCNKDLKAKISRFFTCFFCLTPLRLECSRSRKTASFLTSHTLKKHKNLHPGVFTNGAKTL